MAELEDIKDEEPNLLLESAKAIAAPLQALGQLFKRGGATDPEAEVPPSAHVADPETEEQIQRWASRAEDGLWEREDGTWQVINGVAFPANTKRPDTESDSDDYECQI